MFPLFLTNQRSVASRGFYFYLWTVVTLPGGVWAAEQRMAWLPCFLFRAHLLPALSDTWILRAMILIMASYTESLP